MSDRSNVLAVANYLLDSHTSLIGVEGGKYEQMRAFIASMRHVCEEECIDFDSLLWASAAEYDKSKIEKKAL